MSDLLNNLQYTWHLVSQFVSWEFCRYMGEGRENLPPEMDVLIFLRNMIVERTEKAVSDITKHEIVAKFIMELKSIRSISRMSCIEPLAESVTAIFPKIKTPVDKLVDNLNSFLSTLETIDEDRKEIIQVRMDETINDFIKEANRLLSPPLLLQIVKPFKPKKKVHDRDIFENVLKCLCNDDPITRCEAKIIAVSLKEDRQFEKILRELESKVESDSVQFSISHLSSQTSDNIYSQEFIKNSQGTNKNLDDDLFLSDGDLNVHKSIAGPSNFQPPNNLDADSFHLDTCPPVPGNHSDVPNNLEFQSDFEPPPSPSTDSPPYNSPPQYPFQHRMNPPEVEKENIYGLGGFRDSLSSLRNAPSGLMDNHGGLRKSPSGPREAPLNHGLDGVSFTQPPANKSLHDKVNSILDSTVCIKFKEIYKNQQYHRVLSGSDTSDCEKTEVIRFLTPTLFKKGGKKKENKVVYISDCESNNSTIRTATQDSQKNDPSWTARIRTDCKRNNNQKKSVRQLSDSSFSDSSLPTFNHNIHLPSTSAACPAKGSIAKKRRIQLVSSSPSVQDFVVSLRPTPGPSSQVPLHRGTNTKSRRKSSAKSTKASKKRHKCPDCSNSFKTDIALRRHIFLKHTPTTFADDSDFED